MAKKAGPPTRADFDALRTKFRRLQAEVDTLRELTRHQRDEVQIQFTRIAEMQSILDEERIANGRPREPRPLPPAPHTLHTPSKHN